MRFVLKNEGKLKHMRVLATIRKLKTHAALMPKFPEMEHADPNQASVEPGMKGRVVVPGAGAAERVDALPRARLTQIVCRADPGGDTRVRNRRTR